MTDYEINRRLAEIAGYEIKAFKHERTPGTVYVKHEDFGGGMPWDPLHDWSQLGPLMERFGVDVGPAVGGGWQATDTLNGSVMPQKDEDCRRAICMAIIKAHQDE